MKEVERAQDLIGSDVYDHQGNKIGRVGNVYVDDATHQPEWVTVKTGLLGMKESFVPLEGASTGTSGINVGVSKDKVKDAPKVAIEHGHLSGQEGRDLYTYYGLQRGSAQDTVEAQGPQTTADDSASAQPEAGQRAETTQRHQRQASQESLDTSPLQSPQPSPTIIPPKSMTSPEDRARLQDEGGRHRKDQ